jgi:hypothetical protein
MAVTFDDDQIVKQLEELEREVYETVNEYKAEIERNAQLYSLGSQHRMLMSAPSRRSSEPRVLMLRALRLLLLQNAKEIKHG